MSSIDGIGNTPDPQSDLGARSAGGPDAKKLAKTAEEYVAIENRLAAQRKQPAESPQFTSIFDQLRDRLAK